MLTTNMLAALNEQMGVEKLAELTYNQIRIWGEVNGWKGLAKWCEKSQHSEHDDSHEVWEHVKDNGGYPVYPAIPAPRSAFTDLPDIFAYVVQIEEQNLARINGLCDLAATEHDYASADFLQDFLADQIDSVQTCRLLAKRAMAAAGHETALRMLDKHLRKANP
jgi:ferritin